MLGFLQFIYQISFTTLGLIGVCTVLHKSGTFLKTIEESEKDGYKKAFDQFIIQSIEELNFSVDSVNLLTKNSLRIIELMFDLSTGKKCVKKDKDGKIIITEQTRLNEEYKGKIEELSMRIKKYQDELKKYKKDDDSLSESSEEEDTEFELDK